MVLYRNRLTKRSESSSETPFPTSTIPPPNFVSPEVLKRRDIAEKMGENAKFVLVTGGAGYIGSHMVLELLREDRYVPVVKYYRINIDIALNLVEVMTEFGVTNLLFSSSATMYGTPQRLPIDEDHPTGNCSNPYGRTKVFIKEILKDLAKVEPSWNIILLRYFNPVGAHESGMIGEDPNGQPNNLMPFLTQVAIGKRKEAMVFGTDYSTRDGTGIRDYIHVVDLAEGHVAALAKRCSAILTLGQWA